MREAIYRRRIEFADTDMAGIAHFARFFVFMETAEHRFREELGFPVTSNDPRSASDPPSLGWPRVAASCDYRRPARFGDELEIRVRVAEIGRSSLTFSFAFRRGTDLVAEGRLTSACCRLGSEVRAVPIPDELLARITDD